MDLQHLSKNDGIFRNCVQGITTLKQQVGRNFLGYSFAKFQALPIFFFLLFKRPPLIEWTGGVTRR